jgi:hypothetical protein
MRSHQLPTALTVAPDYGTSPFLWTRYGMRAGGNCCDASASCGSHPISTALWAEFRAWAIEYDGAPYVQSDEGLTPILDWPRFHERGLALARRLKQEVGTIQVIYRVTGDPEPDRAPCVEIMDDASLRPIPRWLGPPFRLCEWIVSGGQTGVDRAALDFARDDNYFQGGWCPRGRRAEDGAIAPHYRLQETESAGYRQRTRRNVLDSDATLILNTGELSEGSLQTRFFAVRAAKPVLVVALDEMPWETSIRAVIDWLVENAPVATLNIAGPRESKRPGIYRLSRAFLEALVRYPY